MAQGIVKGILLFARGGETAVSRIALYFTQFLSSRPNEQKDAGRRQIHPSFSAFFFLLLPGTRLILSRYTVVTRTETLIHTKTQTLLIRPLYQELLTPIRILKAFFM